eukprot:g2539.t1
MHVSDLDLSSQPTTMSLGTATDALTVGTQTNKIVVNTVGTGSVSLQGIATIDATTQDTAIVAQNLVLKGSDDANGNMVFDTSKAGGELHVNLRTVSVKNQDTVIETGVSSSALTLGTSVRNLTIDTNDGGGLGFHGLSKIDLSSQPTTLSLGRFEHALVVGGDSHSISINTDIGSLQVSMPLIDLSSQAVHTLIENNHREAYRIGTSSTKSGPLDMTFLTMNTVEGKLTVGDKLNMSQLVLKVSSVDLSTQDTSFIVQKNSSEAFTILDEKGRKLVGIDTTKQQARVQLDTVFQKSLKVHSLASESSISASKIKVTDSIELGTGSLKYSSNSVDFDIEIRSNESISSPVFKFAPPSQNITLSEVKNPVVGEIRYINDDFVGYTAQRGWQTLTQSFPAPFSSKLSPSHDGSKGYLPYFVGPSSQDFASGLRWDESEHELRIQRISSSPKAASLILAHDDSITRKKSLTRLSTSSSTGYFTISSSLGMIFGGDGNNIGGTTVALDFSKGGVMDFNLATLDISSQQTEIHTGVAPKALTIGNGANTVVLDTTFNGWLVMNLGTIDISNQNTKIDLGLDANALTIGKDKKGMTFDTTSLGKIAFNVAVLDVSNQPTTIRTGTREKALTIGDIDGRKLSLTTSGAGVLDFHMSTFDISHQDTHFMTAESSLAIKLGTHLRHLSLDTTKAAALKLTKIPTVDMSSSATNILLGTTAEALTIVGGAKNHSFIFNTLKDGTIINHFQKFDVSYQDWSIDTATSANAITIGTTTKSIVLDTTGAGALRLQDVEEVDLSSTNSTISLGQSSAALKIQGGNDNAVVMDTQGEGTIHVTFAEINWSGINTSTIKTSTSESALVVGGNGNNLRLDTNLDGRLHVDLQSVWMGDDNAFTLTRPAHTTSAGTDTFFVGQDAANGTNKQGGSVIIMGGSGSKGDGSGGDVILQGGEKDGVGTVGDVKMVDGDGNVKVQLITSEDAFEINTAEVRFNTQSTKLTTPRNDSNALVIGVDPNIVRFDTRGDGVIFNQFERFDVSYQDWSIDTATSANAMTIGTADKSVVLATDGTGALRLRNISSIDLSSVDTSISLHNSSSSLTIGTGPNTLSFDTTGHGRIDLDYGELDVSSQDWTIGTATSSNAITIGTTTKSIVLDTTGAGALRLQDVEEVDLSSTNSTISLGQSSAALKIQGGNDNAVVMDTQGEGTIHVTFAEINWSGINTSTIKTSTSESALVVGGNGNNLRLDTNLDGRLHVDLQSVWMGDDNAFTLTRPAHTTSAGTDTFFVGQDAANGTNKQGGSVIIMGGSGSKGDGSGGDVILQGGEKDGVGTVGDVKMVDGDGNVKVQLITSEDAFEINTAEVRFNTQSTKLTTPRNDSNALVIGVDPNIVRFDTRGDGVIFNQFERFDVSYQDWSIDTATSANAMTIGTADKSVVLATDGTGALRLRNISSIDLSSVDTSISLHNSTSALEISHGDVSAIFDTTGRGKLNFNFETLDFSSMNLFKILSAKKTNIVLQSNSVEALSVQDSTDNELVNLNTADSILEIMMNTVELGWDQGGEVRGAFVLKRPQHLHSHGTRFTISGQDSANAVTGTNGGDLYINAGSGYSVNDGINPTSIGNGGDLVLQPGEGGEQGKHGDLKLQDGAGNTRIMINTDAVVSINTTVLDMSSQTSSIVFNGDSEGGFTIRSGDEEYMNFGGGTLHLCPHCTYVTFGNKTGHRDFIITRPPSRSGEGNAFVFMGQPGFHNEKGGDIVIHGGEGGGAAGRGGSVKLTPGINGYRMQNEDDVASVVLEGCKGVRRTWECHPRVTVNGDNLKVSGNTVLKRTEVDENILNNIYLHDEKSSTFLKVTENARVNLNLQDGAEGQIILVKNVGSKQRVISGINFNADSIKLLLFTDGKWEEAAGFDPNGRRRNRNRMLRIEDETDVKKDDHQVFEIAAAQAEIENLKQEIAQLKETIENQASPLTASDSSLTERESISDVWIIYMLGFIICILVLIIGIISYCLKKVFARLEEIETKMKVPASRVMTSDYQNLTPMA